VRGGSFLVGKHVASRIYPQVTDSPTYLLWRHLIPKVGRAEVLGDDARRARDRLSRIVDSGRLDHVVDLGGHLLDRGGGGGGGGGARAAPRASVLQSCESGVRVRVRVRVRVGVGTCSPSWVGTRI
jgi:hypothetical protein